MGVWEIQKERKWREVSKQSNKDMKLEINTESQDSPFDNQVYTNVYTVHHIYVGVQSFASYLSVTSSMVE